MTLDSGDAIDSVSRSSSSSLSIKLWIRPLISAVSVTKCPVSLRTRDVESLSTSQGHKKGNGIRESNERATTFELGPR